MDAGVEAALIAVAGAMRPAIDPWWIIGSAAVVLLGGDTAVADIDLLTSERDAAALVARLGIVVSPPDVDPRFRSRLFARWRRPDRDVEIMGGFMLAAQGSWSELVPGTRVAVGIGSEAVYAPARDEMIAILTRFGRDKDHARARILARCTGTPG